MCAWHGMAGQGRAEKDREGCNTAPSSTTHHVKGGITPPVSSALPRFHQPALIAQEISMKPWNAQALPVGRIWISQISEIWTITTVRITSQQRDSSPVYHSYQLKLCCTGVYELQLLNYRLSEEIIIVFWICDQSDKTDQATLTNDVTWGQTFYSLLSFFFNIF